MEFHHCAEAVQTSHRILDSLISSNNHCTNTQVFCFFCIFQYVFAGVQNDKYHYDGFYFTQVDSVEITLAAKQ